jgi:galactonate dehydratase
MTHSYLWSRRHLLGSIAGVLPLFGAARPMKITGIDTVFWKSRDDAPFWPHWTWVRIRTDAGVEGIGETYPRGEAEAAVIHASLARTLLGKDPRDIERIWTDLYNTIDFQIAGGAEMRVLSAIDLGLWDLLGKALDTPVYHLIGGVANRRIRLYNTCFPYKYDFNKEPEKIMGEVMEKWGVRGIKIWPFDPVSHRTQRQYITGAQIEEALLPVKRLRDKFGSDIDIMMEFHSRWNLASAIQIARALEPYKPMWIEDMLLPGNFAQYRELANATTLPLIIGERMAGRRAFQQLLDSRAAKYIMFDVCWCGGLSEARKISSMADTYELPIAPHTAGGPLLFYASTHLTTAMPNVAIQESCQRFYESDWPQMLESPLVPVEGTITAPDLPGFGMRIKPEAWNHPAGVRRSTST